MIGAEIYVETEAELARGETQCDPTKLAWRRDETRRRCIKFRYFGPIASMHWDETRECIYIIFADGIGNATSASRQR